jgi:alkyl hydroperoxide reductase subunit D
LFETDLGLFIMTIDSLKEGLGDDAKDIRINLSKILTEDGAPSLSEKQIFLIALSCGYTLKNEYLLEALKTDSRGIVTDSERLGTQTAATMMAMNNIYYRFVHLVGGDYTALPANLRMMSLNNSGLEKIDFELCSLAVSAITGCGMCMESHTHHLEKAGLSKVSIQSAIRIAAVLHATSQALFNAGQ